MIFSGVAHADLRIRFFLRFGKFETMNTLIIHFTNSSTLKYFPREYVYKRERNRIDIIKIFLWLLLYFIAVIMSAKVFKRLLTKTSYFLFDY